MIGNGKERKVVKAGDTKEKSERPEFRQDKAKS